MVFGEGNVITPASAERVAAVYACKTAISESVAMLPVSVYRDVDERTSEQVEEHPVSTLLRERPNSFMDSFEWFEVMQTSLLDYGNAYAFIERKRSGGITALVPLLPERVKVILGADENSLVYEYREPNGVTKRYSQREILHIKYRSRDGLIGRSPIQVAADSIGFSVSLLEHGNSTFENGAFLSGFLKFPVAFKDDEARERFMSSFKKYMGASNAGKYALLEQGAEWAPMSQNNRDAQFLEARQFSVLEIARIYRVPPHVIQCLENGTSYASIEQQSINFVQYTIQPWVVRWERAIKNQLFTEPGEEELYLRFNISSLIRGDLKSRTEALVLQLQYGLKTINEARKLLDENAVDIPVADSLLLSHNLIPAERVGEEPAEEPKEAPAEESDEEEEPEEGSRGDFRPLLAALLARLTYREQNAALRAANKPNFGEWAEKWWHEERKVVSETLEPAFRALGASAEHLERTIAHYCALRRAQLSAAPFEAPDDVENITNFILSGVNGDGIPDTRDV